ncbi:MAG: AAA family ATPase, partial [Planctomycetota bacterium]
MRISDLQVDGFGVWKGLSVDRLSPDITVFYGQNEAGKTTLMQFVRSMLFGFAADRLEKYTPPVYGGVAGGSLFVKAPQGTYEIQRHVDPSRPVDAVGDLSLIDTTDGDLHGNAQLSQMLSQIDESIFNNVFSVGLREIQELGALNNTQAAEHLYRLTSGLDRVSLVDVMRDLKSRREAIWSDSEGHESRLVKLNHRKNALKKEIDELRGRTKRWARVATQAKDANRRLDEIQGETKRLERESKLVDVSMQISERWNSRNLLTQQIEGFGKLPDPRDVEVRRLDEINERIAKQKEKIEQTSGQRVKLHRDAAALPLNRLVWRNRNRIEALAAHTPWLESLQRQAHQLRAEIDKIEGDLNGEVSGLGTQLKLKNRDIHELGSRRFQAVRSVARQLAEQN